MANKIWYNDAIAEKYHQILRTDFFCGNNNKAQKYGMFLSDTLLKNPFLRDTFIEIDVGITVWSTRMGRIGAIKKK